jgi:hypothetical protein
MALNKALRGYIYNPKIVIENINKEYEFIPKEKVYYQDEVFNYYFIVKNKIKDLIKFSFVYYNKNKLIKDEYIFKERNIIKEKDGDIISKIIIGNILNNNTSIQEKEEISLAKKYQVLSKSTALYAEIENEKANKYLTNLQVVEQKDLTYILSKSNINYLNKSSDESSSSSEDIVNIDSDSDSSSSRCKKKKKKKKRKCRYYDRQPSSCKAKSKLINYDSDYDYDMHISPKKDPLDKYRYRLTTKKKGKRIQGSDSENEYRNYKKKKIEKESSEEEISGNKQCDFIRDDDEPEEGIFDYNFKEMVLTQNLEEGNWNLNFQTKFLINKNELFFDKIKAYVEKYYKNEDMEDIVITILVLYCIKNNKNIELSEYLLIFNKGMEYLQSKGVRNICYEKIEPYLNNLNIKIIV